MDICISQNTRGVQRTTWRSLFLPFIMWDPRELNSGQQALQQQAPLPTELSLWSTTHFFTCFPPSAQSTEWKDPEHCFSHSGCNYLPSGKLSWHSAGFSALGKFVFHILTAKLVILHTQECQTLMLESKRESNTKSTSFHFIQTAN